MSPWLVDYACNDTASNRDKAVISFMRMAGLIFSFLSGGKGILSMTAVGQLELHRPARIMAGAGRPPGFVLKIKKPDQGPVRLVTYPH
jgi:hypothetical protein